MLTGYSADSMIFYLQLSNFNTKLTSKVFSIMAPRACISTRYQRICAALSDDRPFGIPSPDRAAR